MIARALKFTWPIAALCSVLAAPAAAAESQVVVRRTTLIVADMDASLRFYRDVLGFEVWLENRGKVTPSSLPVDVPIGGSSRFAIMKGKHPWVGMVGLLEYGGARQPAPPQTKVGPGDVVLMLEVSDVAGIHERMQKAGTRILKPPETSEVTGAGGAKWTATFLFAYDPDGHLLEINQRHAAPSAAPAATAAADARVTRAFADVRTGQLHYRRADPVRASGLHTPVVLLHQSPLSSRMFAGLLPVLGTDRVVYALDTPGYGESDPPNAPPPLGDYAEALYDFIATLNEPVDLVGYHTGAMIAVEIARRHPQSVRRLVLIAVPLLSAERRATLGAETPIAEDGSHLVAAWRSTMSVRPAGQSLAQVEQLVAEKQRAGRGAGWALAAIRDYDAETALRALSVPTVVIRPKDALWDPSAAAAALVPGATLIDAPDWSYGMFDAEPQAVATRLRATLDN
jgi:pimeloyl-ACP methyl ester carboxylesterase/catechol 2,3-dioxygenase-like lactoylglutathione lyase family enzyme